MMVSFLGSVRQTLQVLFLIRFLVIQPLWVAFKKAAVPSALNTILYVLSILGDKELPLE
jgi:hypothetical protein